MIKPSMMENADVAYRAGYYDGYYKITRNSINEFTFGPVRYQYDSGRKQGEGDAEFDTKMQERMQQYLKAG